MKAFAKNLASTRRSAGLSQERLAQKAGVSTSYVSMLEREQRSPPLETVEKFAKALKVAPQSLLTA
jgi:transcriptional regulator with XRE-family HTH domain